MRCGVRARLDFNPRSPDGERRRIVRFQASRPDISIHAPRMGSDRRFRPFAPRNRYFNPRSPDGERLMQNHLISSDFVISIHAPRMGSDRVNWYDDYHDVVFQSTLPGWGATVANHIENLCVIISIHAPRMGSDSTTHTWINGSTYFNPRSPDGERRVPLTYASCICQFQSTLPGWGATPGAEHAKCGRRISIHAPRMGSDHYTMRLLVPRCYFNPRSPDGERPDYRRQWMSDG